MIANDFFFKFVFDFGLCTESRASDESYIDNHVSNVTHYNPCIITYFYSTLKSAENNLNTGDVSRTRTYQIMTLYKLPMRLGTFV